MSSQGWCRVGLAVSGEQLVWCSGNVTESAALDEHRSERRMAARVLRVLRGLAGLNAGASGAGWGGLGRHFLWENSCYHTVIPHQGLVPGSRFQLDQTHSACQRGTCVCQFGVFMCLSVCVWGCVWAQWPLTAAKLQWTGMSIHREVFQVHGTFCSYCQPGKSQKAMDSELEEKIHFICSFRYIRFILFTVSMFLFRCCSFVLLLLRQFVLV